MGEEVKFKPITHKERKEWLKKIMELDKKEDGMAGFMELTAYREQFLKDHIEGSIDLDSKTSVEVDALLSRLEGDMDFSMGLKRLMSLNSAPSKVPPSTPKPGK